LCRTCALLLRRYSAQATAEATPVADAAPKIAHRLSTAVVLSRPPQITRDLHPFEKAFFLYQRRLNERLALPFQRYLYFKKESPALIDFQRKIKERKTPARDIGPYEAYGKDRWHDEVHVGAALSEPEHQMEELLKDEENTFKGEQIEIEVEDAVKEEEQAALRPRPRVTEADAIGDVKSLNRMLQRTLYLLVLGEDGQWRFPTAQLVGKENLKNVRSHHAKEDELTSAGRRADP
jgi:large subunit ribosomal protein L46